MPAWLTNTSNRQIISRPDAAASSVAAAKSHPNQPIDADGGRLLSPHEIAVLMVLASERRCQQADPADLRCLVDRGLVRLDAPPLAEAPARLSDDGRRMVLRLDRRERATHGRNVDFEIVRRTITAAASIGALRYLHQSRAE
ncbi:hypothetical protein [Burkholderia pyrrocinia]|uniref:hypothetical protein n=1 Tax=Burkholderia pyrrocinia TaxID=60550 RepID=UPI00158DA63E|nr:hypothetical protein [Burkholderia pyrrocinia]